MGLLKSSNIFYTALYFLHSGFFVRLGIPFLRPDPHMLRPTRTGPVKARPGNDGACGQGRATADLDSPCARRPQHVWVGAKKRDSESNKETGMKEVESGVKYVLDFKSPIQGLLRLHSRYGPPYCSTA